MERKVGIAATDTLRALVVTIETSAGQRVTITGVPMSDVQMSLLERRQNGPVSRGCDWMIGEGSPWIR